MVNNNKILGRTTFWSNQHVRPEKRKLFLPRLAFSLEGEVQLLLDQHQCNGRDGSAYLTSVSRPNEAAKRKRAIEISLATRRHISPCLLIANIYVTAAFARILSFFSQLVNHLFKKILNIYFPFLNFRKKRIFRFQQG